MKSWWAVWHHGPHSSQTKQGYRMCLVSIYFFPPHTHPPLSFLLFFFLPPFFRESGRRKQEVAALQEFGSLSAPTSERGTTAPLVGDWNWCLSLPFPPFTQDHPLFRSSLISRSSLCSLPLGGAGKANQRNLSGSCPEVQLAFDITEIWFCSVSLLTNTVEYSYFSSGWVFHSLVSPCKKKFLHACISLSHADDTVSSDNMRLYHGCHDHKLHRLAHLLLVTFRRRGSSIMVETAL